MPPAGVEDAGGQPEKDTCIRQRRLDFLHGPGTAEEVLDYKKRGLRQLKSRLVQEASNGMRNVWQNAGRRWGQ